MKWLPDSQSYWKAGLRLINLQASPLWTAIVSDLHVYNDTVFIPPHPSDLLRETATMSETLSPSLVPSTQVESRVIRKRGREGDIPPTGSFVDNPSKGVLHFDAQNLVSSPAPALTPVDPTSSSWNVGNQPSTYTNDPLSSAVPMSPSTFLRELLGPEATGGPTIEGNPDWEPEIWNQYVLLMCSSHICLHHAYRCHSQRWTWLNDLPGGDHPDAPSTMPPSEPE